MSREVFILSYARTPIGAFQGALKDVTAPKLGAIAIKGALDKSGLNPNEVNEVIMGNVLSAGVGQAPARQASIYAGLPKNVECLTINKMCGSGLKAIMLGSQAIASGDADIIIAGGMESMSNAPYYLPKGRSGMRLGHGQVLDGIIHDGLWDVYNDQHMGNCAEMCADKYKFSREEQDQFAKESYKRSLNAIEHGLFKNEIVPVEIPQRKGDSIIVDTDEEPGRGMPEKFPKLRPAFQKDGTVTAANASSINDGSAVCILISGEKAKELGLNPEFKIIGHGSSAQAPEWFTTAPAQAMKKVSKKTGVSMNNIDLFEINEAFSVVTMAAVKEFNLDSNKVNINGGAVSLGHPIGASGARILITLMNAMSSKNVKTGMASICIGGGEASAMIVERD
jgi:acetyl-CoA C-acetyltransferase